MALTVIKPSGLDTSGNFTVNGMNVSANASIANLTITNSSNLGTVGNIYIGGGTNGQYLQTNGSGVLTWTTITVSSASISNGNSNVNIPSANGNVNISAVGNTTLVVTGTGANIAGTLNVTGDTTVGNITSSGSGGNISNANVISANTLTASGNITAGNANLGNAVSANYFIGNLYGTANSATTATTAGTVTTAAQPNITSVGTLSSLNVSGTGSFGGNVNLNSFNITSLATPVASTDAATKQYVDDVAQGLNVHDAAAAATNDTLANITSGTITYNNGSSGVGANLTTTGSFNLIDGVNVQTSGTRILVKNEANAVLNGIYTWSNATVITRATDYNSVPEVEAGDFVFVTGGTIYDNTGWVQTSTVSAIGTAGNNIEFTQFSGAGTYQAGTGLTLTGTTFSVNANQSQVTNVGTLGNLTVSGNATVGNLISSGSGGNISNVNVISANTFIASGNITAGNINAGSGSGGSITGGNLVSANYLTGTLTTAAQPNITSVGTLSGLTSTGTINFTGASNTSLGPVGNVHITGGSSGQYLQTDGSGTLSWTSISVSSASISNGNSNVNIPAANGNVNISAAGNANIVVVTGTGVNVAGTLNVTGNATVGNLITSGSGGNISNVNVISANTFTASGNITANNFVTSGSGGNITGGNVISANTFIASGNITVANANLGNQASANYFIGNFYGTANSATTAGTVTTAAQPNITSVGTLTSVTVSGTSNLGPVGNVTITGGTSGQYLQTNGSGVLTWSTVATGSSSNISNGNSNVNIPSANGNVNISAVGNANILVVTGTGVNIAGTLNTTGNTTVGNLFSSGSGGNISNVNVISANTFVASGNITAGNIVTSGAGGNISNANVISANTFTASGNITAGNANLGNAVTANYFIGNFYGTANSATTATSATTAGTVTTAAQPNITSVGTLSSLAVANTVTVGQAAYGAIAVANTTGFYTTWSTAQQAAAWTVSFWVYIPTQSINYPRGLFYNGDASSGQAVQVFLGWNGASTYSLQLENRSGGSGSNFTKTLSGAVSQNAWHFVTVSYNGTNTVYLGLDGDVSAVTGSAISSIWAGLAFGKGTGSSVQFNTYGPQTYTDVELTLGTTSYTSNFTPPTTHPTTAGKTLLLLAKTAGTYITNEVTGSNVSVNGSPTFDSSNPIAPTGTLTVAVNSNLGNAATANYFIGSGIYLTGITTAGVSNGNSNINIPSANGNINFTAVGNTTMVVTGTGVNVAGTLNATGNVSVGNLTTTGSGGNITNANVISANTITASGNLNGTDLSLSGNGVFGGNLTVNGTLTYINSTTLSISDPIINLQTGANGAAPTSNSGKDVGTALNYYDTSAKIAWMGWDVSNAEISFASNVGITAEVVTFTSLANIRSGNASLGNSVTANYFIGDLYGTANSATTAGTVTTASQPNITSVGTLTSLTVSGTSNLGAVGNITITGGSNGYVLSTDGSGNLSWVSTSGPSSNIVLDAFTGNGVQTVFALTSTPTSEDYTIVNIDGVSQLHSDYTLSGANLTLSSAPVSGAKVEVMTFNLAGSGGGGGGGSNIANGTSNVSIATSGGNVTTSVGGTGNVLVVSSTGANIAGNLSATNVNFTAFKETVVAGGSVSGTVTPDVAAGTIYNYTLNGNVTINALGNAVAGSSAVLILTQDATGGRTLTSTMKFAGNSKTLSTAGASIDIMTVFYDGTTYYATLSKGYA